MRVGVKICKACKKPMKATDTHCRTCGAEYKNSPVILIVILLIVFGGGYFAWSKYQNTQVERLTKAQAERELKINNEKQILVSAGIDSSTAQEVAEIKLAENKVDQNPQHRKDFESLLTEWADAEKLAGSTGRIALAQPVTKLQEIKRKLESATYSGCLEASRLLFILSMNSHIDAYIEFMRGSEGEAAAQLKFSDYVKQAEQAKKEYESCK